uniref:MAM domain-containing protein n=1 Tax=Timema tahoe TaxID=61484 RepID=A0A7R9IH80_9NEOP|nr:unnamed protein product [Timema tahoe]
MTFELARAPAPQVGALHKISVSRIDSSEQSSAASLAERQVEPVRWSHSRSEKSLRRDCRSTFTPIPSTKAMVIVSNNSYPRSPQLHSATGDTPLMAWTSSPTYILFQQVVFEGTWGSSRANGVIGFDDITFFAGSCSKLHVVPSSWSKIQQLGLSTTYKDEKSEEGKWLHYCFGLTYLDFEDVGETFSDLMSVQPSDERLTKFMGYLTENYIDEDEEPPFPLPSWWKNLWTCVEPRMRR